MELMKRYSYEIYLVEKHVGALQWQELMKKLTEWCGFRGNWGIEVEIRHSTVYYYLYCARELPASIGAESFLIKPIIARTLCSLGASARAHQLYFLRRRSGLPEIVDELKARNLHFVALRVAFCVCGKVSISTTSLFFRQKDKLMFSRFPFWAPAQILAIDFNKYSQYLYRSFPKYLKVGKTLPLLTASSKTALLRAEIFPCDDANSFLGLSSYDFYKHSLILGASGSGKSKFIALLISKILREYPEQYRIVVIDPHDALRSDFVEDDECRVTDFTSLARSVDLFAGCTKDINVSVELSLTIFESLMANNYNSYADRVLRYAIFVLLKAKKFSLVGLRQLLSDVEYRHGLIELYRSDLPDSVVRFFLTEYNTLRTQHYDQAIAPIIAFIDELQMVPVFSSHISMATLLGRIQRTPLNIFSLSRARMGTKVVKMVAGLLLQQLFTIAQNQLIAQHLIVVVDEVAVVENPILARFLSELRKYQTSVILIGQYFQQFSDELRSAIYANVTNYYIFKVSRDDASVLAQNLNITLSQSNSIQAKVELLTSLKARECIVQLSAEGTAYPAVKTRTLDYKKRLADNNKLARDTFLEKPFALPVIKAHYVATGYVGQFCWNGAENIESVMRSVTTRRKKW